jgi:hypothetical protein
MTISLLPCLRPWPPVPRTPESCAQLYGAPTAADRPTSHSHLPPPAAAWPHRRDPPTRSDARCGPIAKVYITCYETVGGRMWWNSALNTSRYSPASKHLQRRQLRSFAFPPRPKSYLRLVSVNRQAGP